MRRLRAYIADAVGQASATPLGVLFVLNLVDELDAATFGVLAPEIRDTFGVSEATVVSVGGLSAALVIMLALPIGHQADRRNRVRMVQVAAVLWGVMCVLTGVSGFLGAIGLLVLARAGSGLGKVMNEPVHVSLLADYYPTERHGRVYSIHKAANAIGAGCTPLCGLLADAMGWRAAFIMIAIPTFLAWTALLRLREPNRGASIDPVAAAARAAEGIQRRSFRDGARALRAVPSLRRICVASFAIGAAILPIALFVSFYFEKDHGIDSGVARGGIVAIVAVGSLVGLHLGSTHATKALMAGDLPRLATLAGWSLGLTGLGFLALALAPWTALAVAITLVLGLGGAINSFALPLLAAVTPPALRSQAGGWFGFSAGLGVLLVAPPAAALGESLGYRWAISVLSLVLAGAGIAVARIAPHVQADADRAYASLFTGAPTTT